MVKQWMSLWYNFCGMKQIFCLLLFPLLCFPQTAEDVVSRLEKSLRSLQSLEAKFSHIYYSAMVSTPLNETGKLYFQKPDQMRWEYKDPENNIYLYKGDKFQFYFSEDNQLMKGSLSEENHETEILDILTGQKTLLEFYNVEFSPFPTEKPQNPQIKLTPKQEEEDSFILLEIDKSRWLIQKAAFIDWEGNKTEFQFDQIQINTDLPKNIFELKLPPDVEIIER
jgi:outer membrane lipoprotein carrier protein